MLCAPPGQVCQVIDGIEANAKAAGLADLQAGVKGERLWQSAATRFAAPCCDAASIADSRLRCCMFVYCYYATVVHGNDPTSTAAVHKYACLLLRCFNISRTN